MRRRSLLAALPPALATGLLLRPGTAPAQPAAPPSVRPPAVPGFQPAGADRFIRPDVHAGDRPFGASFASRSAAMGCNGAAGTAHPIATQIAIAILHRGGSAVDAAVAANAALGFLEPTSAGLGGDCYAMLWDQNARRVVGLAGSGASPRALSLETVRSRAVHGALPPRGAVSVSVPGALDAWWTLHRRYGVLPWRDLFQPAIALAQNGVPLPQIIGGYIWRNLAIFTKPGSGVEETANAMHTYAPGGTAPREGQVFRNPDLARTYSLIAEGGRDVFYDGEIADIIARYFHRIGGWMTRADLAHHHSEWNTPLTTDYRGVTVHGMAANTQGIAT